MQNKINRCYLEYYKGESCSPPNFKGELELFQSTLTEVDGGFTVTPKFGTEVSQPRLRQRLRVCRVRAEANRRTCYVELGLPESFLYFQSSRV